MVGGNITTTQIKDPNYLSWKTGILEFHQSPLANVTKTLADFYAKPIVLGDQSLADEGFHLAHRLCAEIGNSRKNSQIDLIDGLAGALIHQPDKMAPGITLIS